MDDRDHCTCHVPRITRKGSGDFGVVKRLGEAFNEKVTVFWIRWQIAKLARDASLHLILRRRSMLVLRPVARFGFPRIVDPSCQLLHSFSIVERLKLYSRRASL